MNKMKLKVIKDIEYGINVIENIDEHFSLCLFLTDVQNKSTVDKLLDELDKNYNEKSNYCLSLNTSVIEIYSKFAIVSDQEDEFHWFFDTNEIKLLLLNWMKLLKIGKFPTVVNITAKLIDDVEYKKYTGTHTS